KGLVRHQEDHEEVLLDFYRFFREAQWAVRHIAPSIIQGKTGNIEFLVHPVSEYVGYKKGGQSCIF
ncbi:MAG TPA: TlyA family rRNA (cytidine-2'-O)-methyltransferase, partial [Candidatus Hydrogenedentes bacterium]|nr:TlyA family rRNA (cytidine-2'-O)-methyltransferase [Candidatus Hydrogenedentota bacterium]